MRPRLHPKSRHKYLSAVVAVVALGWTASGADAARARHLHRRAPVRHVPAPAVEQGPAAGPARASRDGGVTGNLPFDNQLRKFSDPLGANGR